MPAATVVGAPEGPTYGPTGALAHMKRVIKQEPRINIQGRAEDQAHEFPKPTSSTLETAAFN